jgi:hypothetical protein
MRLRNLFMLGALGLSLKAQAEMGLCALYRETFQSEIKTKIQAGVPFELMSALFVDGKLIDKKAIRVAYNLWDEVVTLKAGEQTVARFPMAKAATEVCKYLELETPMPPGSKCTFRLLLNPLWAERITRLQVTSQSSSESARIMGINWRKLANEMPSDKVLLEKEMQR